MANEFLSKEQKNILSQEIPQKLIQTSPDGFKYTTSPVIVEILNKAFDGAWNWEIVAQGIEPCRPYPKHPQVEGHYAWVKGRLSYPFKVGDSIQWAYKEAFGNKTVIGGAKVQTQLYKSAATDAFKKAASLIGIAPNVYASEDVYLAMQEEKANEDTWTKLELDRHAATVAKIQEYKDMIGELRLDEEKMAFCDKTGNYTIRGEITPSNVEEFAEYLNSVIKPEDFQQAPKLKVSNNPFDMG